MRYFLYLYLFFAFIDNELAASATTIADVVLIKKQVFHSCAFGCVSQYLFVVVDAASKKNPKVV